MADDMSTRAARLRWAIDQRFRDVKSFQEEMSGAKIKGSSKGSVQAYLDGHDPSMNWTAEAARVLGVREAWLAFGEGAPTEEEERARFGQAVNQAVRRNKPAPGVEWWGEFCREWTRIPPETQSALILALERWVGARRSGKIDGSAPRADNPVRSVFNDTLDTLGVDAKALSTSELDKYAMNIALAIMTAIPASGPPAAGGDPNDPGATE